MSINLTIRKAREQKDISQKDMSIRVGVSPRTYIDYEKEGKEIPFSKMQSIAYELGIDLSSFNKSDEGINVIEEEMIQYKTAQKNIKTIQAIPIPLVNVKAVGGFGNASFAIEEHDVEDYYVIPKFKYRKVDFMIEVVGDSMRPRYKGGDIVACQVIKNRNFIQWNRVHVIATEEQGVIIKRIAQGAREGYIKVIADNPDYPAFEIPESEVKGIALVAGGVVQD